MAINLDKLTPEERAQWLLEEPIELDEADYSDEFSTSENIDQIIYANRAVEDLTEQSAIDYVRGLMVFDPSEETPYHLWDLLPEKYSEIRKLPGCSHAFRWMLREVVYLRNEAWASPYQSKTLSPKDGPITTRLLGMIHFLAEQAETELDAYQREEKDTIRPADTYRAYGLALRYATESLGNLQAKKALARLMLATPLPVDELENPDWIDPYTGLADPEYVQFRVREVSGDGNSEEAELPALVQDLLDNLSDQGREDFQKDLAKRGETLDDYWLQFKEAQRSGYSAVEEPEEEQEREMEKMEDDLDAGEEKDFQFKKDLKVDYDVVDMVKKELAGFLEQVEAFIKRGAEKASKVYEQGGSFDFNAYHLEFRKFPAVKELLHQMTRLACRRVRAIQPRDLMAILLPLQHSYGYWEEDLYDLHIPFDHGYTMAHWYQMHGDDFLEQFQRDDVDYGDPEINKKVGRRILPRKDEPSAAELEEFTWRVVFEQTQRYNDGEARRIKWAKEHGIAYKPDAKWHPAFVTAEVEAAILGEGGVNSAQVAAWNAWRDSIDPEANRAYLFQRRKGAKHPEAMNAFWELVKKNRNRIGSVNAKGLILRSGRQIDWGVALLKFKANEIPMSLNDFSKLLDLLLKKQWGTPPLRKWIQEKGGSEMAKLPQIPTPVGYYSAQDYHELCTLMKSAGATNAELGRAHNTFARLLNEGDETAIVDLGKMKAAWEEKYLATFQRSELQSQQ